MIGDLIPSAIWNLILTDTSFTLTPNIDVPLGGRDEQTGRTTHSSRGESTVILLEGR